MVGGRVCCTCAAGLRGPLVLEKGRRNAILFLRTNVSRGPFGRVRTNREFA